MVTVMSTVPALPAGDVAVICVALTTVKLLAAVTPNLTVVAPVKLVPVMVTSVPPLVGPLVGVIPVTVGGEETETAVRTTDVELYWTLQLKPLGKFNVLKVPDTEPAVKIVNGVPACGMKPLMNDTLSVPFRVTAPEADTESYCPAEEPPILMLRAAGLLPCE